MRLISAVGIARSKFYEWIDRYGKENTHGGQIPRDFWLLPEERRAIIDFHRRNPLNGYRRLAFMMIDQNVVCVSPKTVYRVLKSEGLIGKSNQKPSSKGTGFVQPEGPHRHWHTDISYVNVCGTFYYLCSVLDGFSRFIVHWELRESMTEAEVELVLQRALERHPGVKPRVISDNGPQFISRDFKQFIRLAGMDHVRTSPYYPQSNGKIERWHKELKQTCIRAKTLDSYETTVEAVTDFVRHYNEERLHAAIGYVTPRDMLEGRAREIHQVRDQRLEEARRNRRLKRRQGATNSTSCGEGYGSAGGQPERPHTAGSKEEQEAA